MLTLLPSRIFRNFTEHKFVIYFAQEPSFKKVTQIFPLPDEKGQPTSALYSGDYCYFGVEGIHGTSSAVNITEPGVEQFYVGNALICLQTSFYQGTLYCDLYSENLLQFAFLNKTNTDLEVSQV